MWVYKVKFWNDCDEDQSQGLVAGETFADCYKALEKYYGENIIELTIHALDVSENVLDFVDGEYGLTYENFIRENS